MSTIEQDHHHLTEDLILEILSYLPPNTLVRFISVSKTWYSLISNSDFRRRHTAIYQFHRSNRQRCGDHLDDDHRHMLEGPCPPGILLNRGFCFGDSNIVIYPHPGGLDHEQKKLALLLENLNDYRPAPLNESSAAPAKKESFMLADSCNGLLLYVHIFTRKEEEKKDIACRTFYVCNPITKDYTKLPTIDINEFKEQEPAFEVAQIVFNPSFSLTYKVFIWVQCVNRSSSRSVSSNYGRLYVYSSEARSWRLSVPEFRQPFSFNNLKAVLWNGVLHWNTFVYAHTSTTDAVCVCYDIEKETVWTMKCPKMAMGYTHRILLYFGLCGERLLLILKSLNNLHEYCFPTSFDVMELKQHNREGDGEDIWSVRYHVNFKEVDYDYYLRPKVITNSFMGCHYVSILDIYKTMGRNKKGEEEEEMLLIKVGRNKMISFSLTNNTFGLIEELSNRDMDSFLYYINILQYTITLYPP